MGIVWYDNGSILWGRAGLFPETVKLAVRFSVAGEILGERRVNVAWNSEGTAVIDCLRVMMWTQDVDGIGAVSYKVESRNWEKSNNVIAKEDGKLRELVLEDLRRVVTENGGWNVVDEFRISIDVR